MELRTLVAAWALLGMTVVLHAEAPQKPETKTWQQWRGPTRDGQFVGAAWPDKLSAEHLKQTWRVELAPSYSGPLVSETTVFVTETRSKKDEIVRALDRATGKELWQTEWAGAISVPFFAKSNGDWIRATPAFDGTSLFVPGIRDVLVSLDGKTGKENWRIDFCKEYGLKAPDFGLVCSPIIDGDALYIQAANSVIKVERTTGKILWRALESREDIMESGAFSSPVIAMLAGERQLVVQSRDKLAGVDLATGEVKWSQKVPSFRGMNILTPVVVGDAVFTSSYQNRTWLYGVAKKDNGFAVEQTWTNTASGYMSTPVVIDNHAYLHLGNQRYTCIELATGKRTWTSPNPFGKYASLVANGDKILALDQRGILYLLKANPQKFEQLDEREISTDETWAHLAVAGDQLFVRELKAMAVYQWVKPAAK